MVNFKELIDIAGGQTAAANILGVKQQNIQYYVKNHSECPSDWVLKLESATGIPCWEIRPDLYPKARFKNAA